MPKVLVADDEAHIVYLVSMKLRGAGLDVVVATDGQEALETALREHPDCIVTDLQMPKLDGLEVCAKLRNIPEFANVPIILLTAKGFELDAEVAQSGPIYEVVTKPFSPRELLRQVRQAITRAEEASQTPTRGLRGKNPGGADSG